MMAEDWNAAEWAKGTNEDKEWQLKLLGMEGRDCGSVDLCRGKENGFCRMDRREPDLAAGQSDDR